MSDLDVLVIGGGISGLSAAWSLTKAGASVVVLEARNRVGGRTYTKVFNGQVTDAGGAYIGPTQNRVFRMLRDLNLSSYKIHDEGKIVFETSVTPDGRRVLTEYTDVMNPPLGILASLDTNATLRRMTKLCDEFPTNEVWKYPQAAKYDKMTVQQWIDQEIWVKEAKETVELCIKTILCANPSEVSLLYWIFYLKSGVDFDRIAGATNGAQERKIVGGAQQISIELAKRVNVRLEAIVQTLRWDPNGTGGVTALCRDGREFKAKYVILALSPTLWKTITFEPSLPAQHWQLSQRIPMGSIIKTMVFYERAFWRETGHRGQIICPSGPVVVTYDDCKPDGSNPTLMGFVVAHFARELCDLPEEERKARICQQYAEVFRNQEALKPVGYVEMNWSAEEFSGGCYVGFMGPTTMTQLSQAMREPLGPIHFAGTEVATEWCGYMDGAIQAGEKAAHAIQKRLAATSSTVQPPSPLPETEPEAPEAPVKPFPKLGFEEYLPTVPVVLYGALSLVVAGLAYALRSHL